MLSLSPFPSLKSASKLMVRQNPFVACCSPGVRLSGAMTKKLASMQEAFLKGAGRFSGMRLHWLPSQARLSMWTRSEQGESQQS